MQKGIKCLMGYWFNKIPGRFLKMAWGNSMIYHVFLLWNVSEPEEEQPQGTKHSVA